MKEQYKVISDILLNIERGIEKLYENKIIKAYIILSNTKLELSEYKAELYKKWLESNE